MNTRILIAALLLIPFLTGGQSNKEKPAVLEPVKVKTLTVQSETYAHPKRYSGTVEEENGTSLSFATAGTVQTLHIHLGQHVNAGQLIATLDPASSQNSYQAARAVLEQAEDAYRRMKELHDKGSLPDMKWVEVQSKLEQARSMEQIAKEKLDDCKLYAPYSGVVAEKSMEIGQNVAPGMPVARLVTAASLVVKISVPETEIASVRLGQEAEVIISALNGKKLMAKVSEKGVVAHPLSRTYEVKMKVENPNKELMPGMVTEASLLPYPTENRDFYVIPAYIVQIDEHNHSFVWTVEKGKAHKRFIVCNEYTADGVIVSSGLSANDQIIVEGQQKVCEGTEVAL